jgi:SLT domain-containing protein
MTDVSELMLKRFAVLYGEPKTNDLSAFVAEYEHALAGMSREVLTGGANRVIKAQEYRTWPTPGECVKACHAEAEHLAVQRERFAPKNIERTDKTWTPPTEEQKERARELVARAKQAILAGEGPPETRRVLTERSRRMTGEAAGGE